MPNTYARYPVQWSACCVWVLAIFICSESFASSQKVVEEIQKHQVRYSKLDAEFIVGQRRIASSGKMNPGQDRIFNLLFTVSGNLSFMEAEFSALQTYITQASMVTEKRSIPISRNLVETHRASMIKRTRVFTQYIQKALHPATDQEITRLLLEARDLFRSSADLLERLQITETGTH
jgi:hypothetical protein